MHHARRSLQTANPTAPAITRRTAWLRWYRYPFLHFSPSWESIYTPAHLARLLTQFSNQCSVHCCALLPPSSAAAERAEAARSAIVATIGACAIDQMYEHKQAYHARLGTALRTLRWRPLSLLWRVHPVPSVRAVHHVGDVAYALPEGGRGEGGKRTLDLYLPGAVEGRGAARSPALVLFVHGGGWRRGDRRCCRHFVSLRDMNVMMWLLCVLWRTYGNVGHALASNGVPCAVGAPHCPSFAPSRTSNQTNQPAQTSPVSWRSALAVLCAAPAARPHRTPQHFRHCVRTTGDELPDR